ncbi:MAG: DUF4389 domain-containing protein [Gammaproteobacteria bacterium]
MDDDLKQNLTAGETWIRGLFILLFAFALVIARFVTGAVVVIQFLFTVFTGQTNDNLKIFGGSLARYVYNCLLFVTYNSDDKPFPFSEWPAVEGSVTEVESAPVKATSAVEPKARSKAKPKTKPKAKPKVKPKAKPKEKKEADAENKAED